MNGAIHKESLQGHLPYWMKNYGCNNLLHHDNNLKIAFMIVKQWFLHKQILHLKWPAQTFNTNSIENIWN